MIFRKPNKSYVIGTSKDVFFRKTKKDRRIGRTYRRCGGLNFNEGVFIYDRKFGPSIIDTDGRIEFFEDGTESRSLGPSEIWWDEGITRFYHKGKIIPSPYSAILKIEWEHKYKSDF